MANAIKVLIVDDSSIVRRTLTAELSKIPGIEVVGTAPDPFVARDKVLMLKPDVLTLDMEMPRMDGLTFLRKLMKHHPVPTIVLSSLTPKGCEMAIACLEAGAIEVLDKPGSAYSLGDVTQRLGELIKIAARARVRPSAQAPSRPKALRPTTRAMLKTTNSVIAIGASTGGTEALRSVLSQLPRTMPGIIMVQHMPAGFTTAFAKRLNSISELEVREARNGDAVVPGTALLAPGDKQMKLTRDGARYVVRISDAPRVCRHRPSVEVLFQSTARYAGSNALGVIMTGMGDDGATGMLAMHDAGAVTLAQDEASCVVYGMPKAAEAAGGVQASCSLEQIPDRVCAFAEGHLTRVSNAA